MSDAAPSLLEPGGFFGAYRIVRPLGFGGMGRIYLVDGPKAGRQYALKLLDPGVAARNPEFVRRFVREAEFSMNVRNPNLVEVYDAGRDEETGLCYLTMEYMEGGSLRGILDRGGALSLRGAWAIARDIARALEFIDANGLVHRDVKPDNILFTADGRAKLTDLGITRFGDASADDSSQTLAGRIVGTPGYIAPEQLMDAHAVDIRADIYSLGVIFHEMLAGERPNAADTSVNSLAKALRGNPLPDVRERRADVPERLARLIGEMTEPDPANRPASAAYLVELLDDPTLLAADHPTARPGADAPHAPTAKTAVPPRAAEAGRDAFFSSAVWAVALALAALAGVILFSVAGR